MMHRRDIDLIARTIADLPLAPDRREFIALRFADSFAAAGVHFSRWEFLQRCGCLRLLLEASLDKD